MQLYCQRSLGPIGLKTDERLVICRSAIKQQNFEQFSNLGMFG